MEWGLLFQVGSSALWGTHQIQQKEFVKVQVNKEVLQDTRTVFLSGPPKLLSAGSNAPLRNWCTRPRRQGCTILVDILVASYFLEDSSNLLGTKDTILNQRHPKVQVPL